MQQTENQDYLGLGRVGKSSWIRYVSGSILIMGSMCFSQIVALVFLMANNNFKNIFDPKTHSLVIDSNFFFIVVESSFIIWLFIMWLVLRLVHERPLSSLVSATGRANLRVIFGAMALLIGVYLVEALITWLVFPQAYQFNFNLPAFLYLLPAALILTPVQSLTEELFFRGYLLQGLSFLLKNKWVLSLASSIPFALGHIDWSQPVIMQLYIACSTCVFGMMLCLVTIRTNSLETAIGAHTANNLFCALLINPPDPILKTGALLRHRMLDPMVEFMLDLLAAVAFYFLAVRFVGKKNSRPASHLKGTR